MDATNPFAHGSTTPEPIIAQVSRQLQADAQMTAIVGAAELERLVDAAVRGLWGSRVKTFVPVLALRAVREQVTG